MNSMLLRLVSPLIVIQLLLFFQFQLICSRLRAPSHHPSGWWKTLEPAVQEEAARNRGAVVSVLSSHRHTEILTSYYLLACKYSQRFVGFDSCVLYSSYSSQFLAEVQIMRGTNHSSIVKLYNFFESLEHYFLVMECRWSDSSPRISLSAL